MKKAWTTLGPPLIKTLVPPSWGGTDFTVVTDGIVSALRRGFGAATVRQYLKAGLVDELHLVQVPLILGRGKPLFAGLEGWENLYECVESHPGKTATHLRLVRKA